MQTTLIDDAEEASFSLNGMLAGFDENTSAYAHMPTKNPYSHFCFALSIEMTAEEVIQALKKYLAALEKGECREVLCIEKGMMRKEYWQKGGLLLRNLQTMRERLKSEKMIATILKVQNGACYDDFIKRLEDSYAEVAKLLGEIHRKMTRQMYGQFYQYMKSQYNAEPAIMAYDEWMMKEGDYSFKTLKGKQTWTVAPFLIREKRPFRFKRVPYESEMNEVQLDLVLEHKPWGVELPDDFKMQCARFRWYCSWEGHILKLDYEALGKYLFQNYYKMTDEERQAFFDLDVTIELVNKDIAKVQPIEEKVEDDIEMDAENGMEQTIGYAAMTMRAEGELKHLYDYTWLMMLMNETKGLPSFDTPTSYVDYMKQCGVKSMPTRSNISKYYDKARGKFPNWTFLDADGQEAKRRNNVAKRFLNLVNSVNNSH